MPIKKIRNSQQPTSNPVKSVPTRGQVRGVDAVAWWTWRMKDQSVGFDAAYEQEDHLKRGCNE
jgi:hypothetical protein